jgi:glycosyltransferase involved in cell wall biosynthesis
MKNFFPNNFLNEINKCEISKTEDNYPKISIVMPSYNQAQFIEKSILSILNQNYPNTELIIIDGGSNDGTIEKIKKYEDKIKFWISEKDQGQSDALNKGFAGCTGDIYGWLNSDDVYLPNTFKNIASIFSKNKDKKIVFGDWLNIGIKDDIIDYHHAFDFNLNHFKYEGFHINAQSMFWHRSVHKNFSGFQINLYNTMDYQMILEFGINEGEKSFNRIPQPFGAFRRYKEQKTAKMTVEILNEHKLISTRYRFLDKYKLIGKIRRLYFRFRRAFWYFKRGNLVNLINRLKQSYTEYK